MRRHTFTVLYGLYLSLNTQISTTSAQAGQPFPDDIGLPEFNPSTELIVSYDNISVSSNTNGVEISIPEAANVPTLSTTTTLTQPHILVMIDPDAPSRADPSLAQILHFLQTDLTPSVTPPFANASEIPLSAGTEATIPYVGPGPPEGSGPHRYVLLLFAQPTGFTLSSSFNFSASNRAKFDVVGFATENQLGPPVAATFYITEASATASASNVTQNTPLDNSGGSSENSTRLFPPGDGVGSESGSQGLSLNGTEGFQELNSTQGSGQGSFSRNSTIIGNNRQNGLNGTTSDSNSTAIGNVSAGGGLGENTGINATNTASANESDANPSSVGEAVPKSPSSTTGPDAIASLGGVEEIRVNFLLAVILGLITAGFLSGI